MQNNENSSEYSIFQDAHPTRDEIVNAAMLYLGVAYSKRGAYIVWNPDLGLWQGRLDCLRFLLHVARDVGYLPSDFDVNLSRPHPKLPVDALMWELLYANLDEIPKTSVRSGDVLLLQYNDINPDLQEAHHVGIVTSAKPAPFGSLIHCEDFEADGAGRVIETRIDIKIWNRIASAWRLRGIAEPKAEEVQS